MPCPARQGYTGIAVLTDSILSKTSENSIITSVKRTQSGKPTVFLDFDNTISRFDIFDSLLLNFSKDDRWLELEDSWKRGEIGSKECLAGQLKSISVTKEKLDKYLSKIKLDRYFKKLLKLLQARGIKTIVLSDNFDYILNRILENNGIGKLKVYSNRLSFKGGRMIPRFDFTDKYCRKCAHCKRNNLFANAGKDSMTIYVGDGLSDICPSKNVDLVFAKEDLLRYCRQNKLPHIPYKELKDVYDYFKKN